MEQGNTMKCNVTGLEGFSGFSFPSMFNDPLGRTRKLHEKSHLGLEK